MSFKFEDPDVWRLSLEYIDLIYEIAGQLPKSEEFNLKSQIVRAATSISLNIAEGSTGQTDAEQARFLGLAVRSLIEAVACQRLIQRRQYLKHHDLLNRADQQAQTLAAKLHRFRKTLSPDQRWLREDGGAYAPDDMPSTEEQ